MSQKTYIQMRNEFQEKFFNEIQPMMRSYEYERLCNLILAIFLTILFAILCVFLMFYSGLKIKSEFLGSCVCGIALFLGFLTIKTLPYIKKSFENSVKDVVMPVLCSCFEDLNWLKIFYYEDENLFYDSNLMNKNFEYYAKYDDIFYGTYNNVKYEILEAAFYYHNSFYECPTWRGVIIKLDMNKTFKGNTVIESHKKAKRGGLMSLFSYNYEEFQNGCKNYTKLEDIDFNKKYDVITDDEVEARYLLTTSFMERLKNMKTAFKTEKIRCSFYNQYLLIRLESKKDLFSICSLFKKVDDSKQFFTLYEEIISIIKLIDHFKLNIKIGM